jgi:hypothetical protein
MKVSASLKLAAAAVLASSLGACSSLDPFADAPPTPGEILVTAHNDIVEHCVAKRDAGGSYVAAADCSNRVTLKAFHDIGYRYMDLVVKLNAQRLALADKVDRREITPAAYRAELLEDWSISIRDESSRTTAFGRKSDHSEQLPQADLFF